MNSLLFFTLLALNFQVTVGTTGIDAIDPISVSAFQCLKNNGYSFFIGRVWTSLGHYDLTGMKNIKNAHAAGVKNVDAYFFPCLKSRCGSAAQQIEKSITKLREENVQIGTFWLDVERLAWPASHASNRKFVAEMVKKAQNMGMTVGLYTNYYNWQEIVGLDYKEFSNLPLWWGDYNNHEDYRGFKPFGGWTKPNMHQYEGNVKSPCGITVDVTWY